MTKPDLGSTTIPLTELETQQKLWPETNELLEAQLQKLEAANARLAAELDEFKQIYQE